jgi:hypothetical protein
MSTTATTATHIVGKKRTTGVCRRDSTSSSSATAPTRAAAGKARQAYELVAGKAAGVAPCRGQPAAVHQCLKGSYVSTHQAASSTVQLCSALRDSVVCTAVALLVWMPSCFLYHFHSYGILVGLAALAPQSRVAVSLSLPAATHASTAAAISSSEWFIASWPVAPPRIENDLPFSSLAYCYSSGGIRIFHCTTPGIRICGFKDHQIIYQ